MMGTVEPNDADAQHEAKAVQDEQVRPLGCVA